MNKTNHNRVLAVSLSSRGFGYAVMEGDAWLVDYGKKAMYGDSKNLRVLSEIKKLIVRFQPVVLALPDVKLNIKGARRARRIQELHQEIVKLAGKQKLKVAKISGNELRRELLGDETGTKQEMAEFIARQYPDELASRLPPKRRDWDSEDARMDIFEAVEIALVQLAAFRTHSVMSLWGKRHL